MSKIKVVVKENYEDASRHCADIVEEAMKKNAKIVLGLATGSSPIGLYKQLISRNKEKSIDFSHVTSFNLDEYFGLQPSHDQSYHYFMDENLFHHVNIPKQNTNVPKGDLPEDKVSHFCSEYEKKIKEHGGVEIQILGIGTNGHIAFNEPKSPHDSRTRLVDLTKDTIEANSRFFKTVEEVPKKAVTMGIGTILESKQIVLVASGKGKAQAVKDAIEGEISVECPASALQKHPNVIFVLDKDASSLLKK